MDVNIPVIAFIGLSVEEQINQFITINREAKGVPTSLYLDLLGSLKNKNPQDIAKERASDIGVQLRRDETSSFFERIVVTRPPRYGEISLTNFVRKVAPLILRDKGFLATYFEIEQRRIIDNYFKGMYNVYTDEFRRDDPIFFRTIGFGAMMNVLPIFFSTCLAQFKGFTVDDVTRAFKQMGDLPFDSWRQMGSGSQAEILAGEDVRTSIELAFKRDKAGGGGINSSLSLCMPKNRHYYQKIERRRWADIRPIWSSYVPDFLEVGVPPKLTLSDFFVGQQLGPSNLNDPLAIPGVHEIALIEAIFLFQKSMHVARAVEVAAQNGMHSWAVFQGYHSAYYAAKGFLALLGVCFPQPDGKQLLLDLFPVQQKRKSSHITIDREVLLSSLSKLEQHLLWGFFGRLLRVTKFPSSFDKHVDFLSTLDHEKIPRFRNRFIYHENHWPCSDLTAVRRIADFAFRGSFPGILSDNLQDHPYFLAVLEWLFRPYLGSCLTSLPTQYRL